MKINKENVQEIYIALSELKKFSVNPIVYCTEKLVSWVFDEEQENFVCPHCGKEIHQENIFNE